jgi:hypothetical protein
MMVSRILIVLQVFLVCALPVMAADVDVRGAVRGDGRYDSDNSTVVIDGRVDFEADIGPLSFGGAYRAYDFGEGGYNPRGIDPVYHIKHRYVEGRAEGLFFRGGHYFSTFGRGLTLRSFEDIGLEHDTSLDGVIAEYEAGPFVFAGLGGRSTEKVTQVQQRIYRLRGARAQIGFGPRVSVAVSGVSRDTEREDTEITLPHDLSEFADHVIGSEAEVWLGPVSLAGEYARRRGDYYPELMQGGRGGHGVYLTGTAATSWSTLLAEYKDYERFEHALINPPTCVRDHVWILMNRITHQVDLGNERGFLAEGTLMPAEDVQITGGASEARRQGGGLAHWEMFGQVDHGMPDWGISSVAGSWSREYFLGRFTEYVTGVIDLVYEIGALNTVEIEFEAQWTEEPSGETFETYLTSIGLYPTPDLTLSLVGETTSQAGLDRDFWLFGDIRTTISGDFEVSLGGGTERGGKKCSGGICLTEPEFTGIRLRFLSYF